MINVIFKPLFAYIYLKYCYAIYHVDKMKTASCGLDQPEFHGSKRMKWRIFFVFQIASSVIVYILWAYLSLSDSGAPDVDDFKLSGGHSRFAIKITLTVIQMIKTIADLILFYYSFKMINSLVHLLQPNPTIFQHIMRTCG